MTRLALALCLLLPACAYLGYGVLAPRRSLLVAGATPVRTVVVGPTTTPWPNFCGGDTVWHWTAEYWCAPTPTP